MLNIYIILCIVLHPHLTSYLHALKACGKSVHIGIISFSTFYQLYWQASRPSKTLHKDCCHFKDWRTDLRTCCLSHPSVGGIFSITLLKELKKELNSSNSSLLISFGVATEDSFLNHEIISFMDVHVSKKKFLAFPWQW